MFAYTHAKYRQAKKQVGILGFHYLAKVSYTEILLRLNRLH